MRPQMEAGLVPSFGATEELQQRRGMMTAGLLEDHFTILCRLLIW